MRPPLAILAALIGIAVAAPAGAAEQRRPQPLVDVAPTSSTAFTDHVGPSRRATARAAAGPRAKAYPASDGLTVSVAFSPSYAPDDEVAQSYVDFLDTLPHGRELGRLRILIVAPREIEQSCGGVEGTLACYDPRARLITVPGEQTEDGGIPISYVLAHEYGHHVARFRSNRPFPSLAFGPKYWASQERVCALTSEGRLAPGDQGENYLSNPGEAWADTYAHLVYPKAPWQYTPLLRPDAAAFAAARRDVLEPWRGPVTRVFRGTFRPGGPRIQAFSFTLRLDGSLRVALRGPAQANYDLALAALGRSAGRTRAAGSRDVYATRYACREVAAERVTVRVVRRTGGGPFTLRVTHAG